MYLNFQAIHSPASLSLSEQGSLEKVVLLLNENKLVNIRMKTMAAGKITSTGIK